MVQLMALTATIIVAKIIGSLLPLLAKRIGFDPAVMASPFITTIVDAIGLIVYFMISAYAFGLTVWQNLKILQMERTLEYIFRNLIRYVTYRQKKDEEHPNSSSSFWQVLHLWTQLRNDELKPYGFMIWNLPISWIELPAFSCRRQFVACSRRHHVCSEKLFLKSTFYWQKLHQML